MAFKCINAHDQIDHISYEYFLFPPSSFCELELTEQPCGHWTSSITCKHTMEEQYEDFHGSLAIESVLFQKNCHMYEGLPKPASGTKSWLQRSSVFSGLLVSPLLELPDTHRGYCLCCWLLKCSHGPELIPISFCSSPRVNALVP